MWQDALVHLFPQGIWQWDGKWTLMTWIGLMIYTSIAAWVDLRERRIPNSWSGLWLMLFLWFHFESRTFESAVLSFILIALFMLIPTLMGIWGQGDWKMAMVLGSAIGALPTLVLWFISFLFVPLLKPWMYRISLRYFPQKEARSIPVAVPVFLAVSTLFVLLWFLNRM